MLHNIIALHEHHSKHVVIAVFIEDIQNLPIREDDFLRFDLLQEMCRSSKNNRDFDSSSSSYIVAKEAKRYVLDDLVNGCFIDSPMRILLDEAERTRFHRVHGDAFLAREQVRNQEVFPAHFEHFLLGFLRLQRGHEIELLSLVVVGEFIQRAAIARVVIIAVRVVRGDLRRCRGMRRRRVGTA